MLESAFLMGGLLAPVGYLAGVISAASVFPGYRHSRQFISELGTRTSPGAARFNSALGTTGLLLGAFAVGVTLRLGADGLALLIALGLGLFALSALAMALLPCDPGCPATPESPSGLAHGLSGLAGSLVLAGAMVLTGVAWWGKAPAFALFSFVAAGGGVSLLALLMSGQARSGLGTVQRLYVGLSFAWILAFALRLLILPG